MLNEGVRGNVHLPIRTAPNPSPSVTRSAMIAKDRWQFANAGILEYNIGMIDASSELRMAIVVGGELTSIWLLPPGLLPLAGGARVADVEIWDRLESVS